MKPHILAIFSALFFFNGTIAFAETLYVTDRILLGIHQEAAEASTLIATIPSGTAVDVLERGDDFIKIKTADGKQGWVSRNYLKPEKPATAELDAAYAQLKQAQETAKKLSDDLDKRERENQARRDELSNAQATIKELQKAMKDHGTAAPAAAPPSKENEEKIAALQDQIKKLTDEKAALVVASKSNSVSTLHDLQSQNQQLQARIEAAVASLKGEQVPTASELAAIRPSFPFWYWILLLAVFIGGIAAGIGWFDRLHRKRHGGFRI
jgi:SH3 domain protein